MVVYNDLDGSDINIARLGAIKGWIILCRWRKIVGGSTVCFLTDGWGRVANKYELFCTIYFSIPPLDSFADINFIEMG